MVPRPRNGLSLCAGAGGLDLGIMLAEPGYHTRCFVEWEPHPRDAIIAGQRAGYFAPAPIWDDVTTFDATPFRGSIDLVAAGYPCQPFSAAGQRKGANDERHLWPDVARILGETDAEWGFFENVSGHLSLGLETVLRDLWDMGRTPAVGLFSSGEAEGAHERQRVFILAHRQSSDRGSEQPTGSAGRGWAGSARSGTSMANPDGGHPGAQREQRSGEQRFQPEGGGSGGADVEDARRSERRPSDAGRHDINGQDAGGEEGHSRAGEPISDVGHPEGIGRGEGRPEHELRSGRGAASGAGGPLGDASRGHGELRRDAGDISGPRRHSGGARASEAGREFGPAEPNLADASGARPQGRERPGSPYARDRPPAYGSAAQCRRPWISPPGPSDAGAWGYVIRMAPDLAPSLALRDVISRANDLAAMVAEGRVAEAQAQSDLRRMAHALAHRPRALRLLGNGVDPLVAGYAFRTLGAAHGLRPLDLEATR